MEKEQRLERCARTEEDRRLLSRVYDKIDGAERKNIPGFTCFLSPRERALVERLLVGRQVIYFGGVPDAERVVCGYLPDYLEEGFLHDLETAPILAACATFFEEDTLTHRDFLGSLMGCGIKRETVGDIFVMPGRCEFLVKREILPFVLQNMTSAGRTKLHILALPISDLQPTPLRTRELRDTVSSLRLDSVVSSGFQMARGKAVELIESGRVELNYETCVKPSRPVASGDTISARGLGKLRLCEVGGLTRKGRTTIVIERFI